MFLSSMNKQSKTGFVYLCTNEPDNVVYSQVAEYIRKQEDEGLFFDLVFLLQSRSYIKYISGKFPNYSSISKLLNGRVCCFPAPLQGHKFGVYLRSAYVKYIVDGNDSDIKTVIHARGLAAAYTACNLSLARKNISFVYDVRGDYLAEYEFIAQQNHLSPEEISMTVKSITDKERATAQSANHIYCVSSILKNRLVQRYNLDESKFTVIPCCADEARFRYNPQTRQSLRKDLGFVNKHVFVYAGGVHFWHCPERLFSVVEKLLNAFTDSFFIALTQDVTKAKTYAQRYLPEGRYLIDSVSPERVPSYLMASDTGILLRERHPLNEVASPTKFAEYMLAGLPIIISDNIGDYSDYVAKNHLGCVWGNDLPDQVNLENMAHIKGDKLESKREHISQLGVKDFSKSSYNAVMRDVYMKLQN